MLAFSVRVFIIMQELEAKTHNTEQVEFPICRERSGIELNIVDLRESKNFRNFLSSFPLATTIS